MLLILDTTIQGVTCGLAKESYDKTWEIVWQQSFYENSSSAVALDLVFSSAEKFADSQNDTVDKILISNGPGSFTGVKVGLSFIFGYVSGLKSSCEVYEYSSLAAVARFLAVNDSSSVVLLPSTKTQGYYVDVRKDFEAKKYDLTEGFVSEVSSGNLYLLGSGIALETKLTEAGLEFSAIEQIERHGMVLKAMLAAFSNCLPLSESGRKLPVPNYLRQSAPEEKVLKEGGK